MFVKIHNSFICLLGDYKSLVFECNRIILSWTEIKNNKPIYYRVSLIFGLSLEDLKLEFRQSFNPFDINGSVKYSKLFSTRGGFEQFV